MYEVYHDKNGNQVYFSKEEVEKTNLPYMGVSKWNKLYITEEKFYLTKSRCKELGAPVKPNEESIGFRFTKNGPPQYRYIPLYDRTYYDIDRSDLYEKEIVKPN